MRRLLGIRSFTVLLSFTVLALLLTAGTASAVVGWRSAPSLPGSSPANPIIALVHQSTPGTYVATLSNPATIGSHASLAAPAASEWCAFTPDVPTQINGSGVGSSIDGGLTVNCYPNPYQQVVFYGCIRHAPSSTGYPNGTWQPDSASGTSYQGRNASSFGFLPLYHDCPGANP
jgi:hypothetical protein